MTKNIFEKLTLNTDPYLSCDECFEQVDAAVEELLDQNKPLSESFKNHLLGCPACHEEAVSLAELISLEHGVSSPDAAAKLASSLK